MSTKGGMVFANAIVPFKNYMTKYEQIRGRLRRALGLKEVVQERGYTGATLVRTRALEGIEIPNVPRQEDKYIKSYCERRGWTVKYASDVVVLHLHKDLPDYRTQYLEGCGLAKTRAISQRRMLLSWLFTYPYSLIALPFVRKTALLREIPKMYYIKYLGYVDALKRKRLKGGRRGAWCSVKR